MMLFLKCLLPGQRGRSGKCPSMEDFAASLVDPDTAQASGFRARRREGSLAGHGSLGHYRHPARSAQADIDEDIMSRDVGAMLWVTNW
jgi:hypothetical protein